MGIDASLTTDVDQAIPALPVAIDPTAQNACTGTMLCKVTAAELDAIRQKIAACICLIRGSYRILCLP